MNFYYWKTETSSGSLLSKNSQEAIDTVDRVVQGDIIAHAPTTEENLRQAVIEDKLSERNHFLKRDF